MGCCIYICDLNQISIRSLTCIVCLLMLNTSPSSGQQLCAADGRWHKVEWAVLSPAPELRRVFITSLWGRPSAYHKCSIVHLARKFVLLLMAPKWLRCICFWDIFWLIVLDCAGEAVTWEHLPTVTAVSPLWDRDIRAEVTKTKMTEQEMHKRRAQLLVPGMQGRIYLFAR